MDSLAKRLTQSEEGLRDYQQERLILEATELICQLLERDGITRAELARRLGKTRPFVTQLLDGRNMTLRTLADVFTVLGRSLHLTAVGMTVDVRPRVSEDASDGGVLSSSLKPAGHRSRSKPAPPGKKAGRKGSAAGRRSSKP